MTTGVTVAHRMKEARLQTALRRHETLSQARMAELVAAEMGTPLHQAQWSNYESGKSEPPLAIIRAAAKLSGLALAYIAFPEETDSSGSPLLDLDPSKDRKLTEEETARAIRRAADEKPPRPRKQTRANGRPPKKDR